MRWTFWLLGLFALAVGTALLLSYNAGYALLVMPPYRVELSLNLLALLVVATIALGYVLVRFVSVVVQLPAAVRRYHERRRRDKARQTLLDAVHAFLEGRFATAERAAAQSLENGESPAVGAALAARAAHELRRFHERDGYLARAGQLAPQDATLSTITAAELLLEERRPEEALHALRALPEKHTAALRLELKAQQMTGNWDEAVSVIDQLERRGAFNAEQAEQYRRYACIENIRRRGLDRAALQECWAKLPARAQFDAKIAAAAARCHLALGDCDEAARIIENSLADAWDADLVALYAECSGPQVVQQIESAEKWLKSHPRDAVLLLALGRLCAHQGLWGKAQSYLEASVAVEASYSAHHALARLHERLGDAEAAQRNYRASLELAIGQLKQMGGGKRRTPY